MARRMAKRYLPFLMAVFFLVASVLISMWAGAVTREPDGSSEGGFGSSDGSVNASSGDETPFTPPEGEMRAVWVPFMTLDLKDSQEKNEEAFRQKFDEIVAGAREYGMNTLIVHVRSHGDAMYPSEYFPWSHLLSGTQGNDPGFDPLEYMVSASHEAGLALSSLDQSAAGPGQFDAQSAESSESLQCLARGRRSLKRQLGDGQRGGQILQSGLSGGARADHRRRAGNCGQLRGGRHSF